MPRLTVTDLTPGVALTVTAIDNAGGTGTGTVTPLGLPALSAPVDTAAAESLNFTASTDTDDATGTLYWAVFTTATPQTVAAIKAGTGAAANGSQAVSGTGTQNISATDSGLAGNTTGYVQFVQTNGSAVDSNVVVGDGFTTATYGPNIITQPTASVAPDGWAKLGTGTLTVVGGEWVLTSTAATTYVLMGTNGFGQQLNAMETGEDYLFELDLGASSNDTTTLVRFGSTHLGVDYYDNNEPENTTLSTTFTATTANLSIRVVSDTVDGATNAFNNLRVRKVL